MKTKLLLSTIMLLSYLHMGVARAAQKEIVCHTPRHSKTFAIAQNRISFYKDYDLGPGREIASLAGVRTRMTDTGFTKIVYIHGNKHILHIEDKSKFSDIDDYLVVRSKEGHEMTYPLSCQFN